jgi:hypothetical protein
MFAILQCDHAGIWNRLSDVLGCSGGDEVVIAIDDQRRDPQALELGKQVVVGRGPCVAHQAPFDCSRLENTLFGCALPARFVRGV